MTDASEADDQAAVPAPRSSGGPRDTSAADSSPESASAGAGPDAASTDTGPIGSSADITLDAMPAGGTAEAASAGNGPDAGPADGGAGRVADWGVTEARRAEVYLRLLAENELRAALAFPRIEPPSDRLAAPLAWAGSAIGAAVSAVEVVTRPVRPAAIRAGRAARPWAGSAAKFLTPPARLLAPPARRAEEAVIMAGWRARGVANWIGNRWTERSWQDDTPSARTCLHRVQAAAHALAATGALGAETARSVADNMEHALMLRHRIEDAGLLHAHLAAIHWQTHTTPAPAGPVRAIPIGATVDIEAHDERARMRLLALVLADGYATVTVIAQEAADRDERTGGEDADEEMDLPDLSMIVDNQKIHGIDDRGGTYRLRLDAGDGCDRLWEGQFSVTPVPPPGVRWLEIRVTPGHPPVHIDLPPVTAADASRAAGQVAPSVADRAERLIDIISQGLLGYWGDPEEVGPELPEAADQVRALQAVGALTPGSPALARLLALIRRLGGRIPAELAEAAAAASVAGPGDEQREDVLPEAWRTVLELPGTDGELDDADDVFDDTAEEQPAIAPATAVFPELDGARCVVTGVRGDADETTVKVLAWGWPPAEFGQHQPGARQFRWLARDDAGRWHIGYENGGSYGEGATELELTLTPPADPAATSLELMLLGLSGEVSVSLPLNWMEP